MATVELAQTVQKLELVEFVYVEVVAVVLVGSTAVVEAQIQKS